MSGLFIVYRIKKSLRPLVHPCEYVRLENCRTFGFVILLPVTIAQLHRQLTDKYLTDIVPHPLQTLRTIQDCTRRPHIKSRHHPRFGKASREKNKLFVSFMPRVHILRILRIKRLSVNCLFHGFFLSVKKILLIVQQKKYERNHSKKVPRITKNRQGIIFFAN